MTNTWHNKDSTSLVIVLDSEVLPIEWLDVYKNQLILMLSSVNEQTEVHLSTDINLAFINLISHMSAWKDPIEDLINNFSQISWQVKLKILTLLPIKWHSCIDAVPKNQRLRMKRIVDLSADTVSSFLNSCMTDAETDAAFTKQILDCHISWHLKAAIFITSPRQNKIVSKSLSLLHQCLPSGTSSDFYSLHKAATDCLINSEYRDIEDDSYFFLLGKFCDNNIWTLTDAYNKYLARGDYEITSNYSHIFVKFAKDQLLACNSLKQSYTMYFVNVLNGMLLVFSEKYAVLTFPFWNLLHSIINQNQFQDPDYFFGNYIECMITKLPKHCKIDFNFQGLLKETDYIFKFRQEVTLLINNVAFLFNDDNVFQKICSRIDAPGADWNDVEAHLFIMESLISNVDLNHEPFLEIIKKLLFTWKDVHVTIAFRTVKIFKESAEWLANSSSILPAVFEFLIQCLYKDGLYDIASSAINRICSFGRNDPKILKPMFQLVLQNVNTSSLKNEVAIRTYKIGAQLVNLFSSENNHASDAFKTICDLVTIPLVKLISSNQNDLVDNPEIDATFWLIRLVIILESTVFIENDLFYSEVLKVFRILCLLMEKYYYQEKVLEQILEAFKMVFPNIDIQDVELHKYFINSIARLYKSSGSLYYLDIAEMVVTILHKEFTYIPHLLEMTEILVDKTEKLLKADCSADYQCKLVESFFSVCVYILNCDNLQFLQWNNFDKIIYFTLLKNSILYRISNFEFSITLLFFKELFQLGGSDEVLGEDRIRVQEFFFRHGFNLSIALFVYYILTDNFLTVSGSVSDVLLEMLNFNNTVAINWFTDILNLFVRLFAIENNLDYFNQEVQEIIELFSQMTVDNIEEGIDKLRELFIQFKCHLKTDFIPMNDILKNY